MNKEIEMDHVKWTNQQSRTVACR